VPTGRLRRASVVAAVGLVALGAWVAGAGDLPGDRQVLSDLRSPEAAALVSPVRVADAVTGSWPVLLVAALLALALARAGRTADARFVAVSVSGAVVASAGLKRVVGRPRPSLLPLEDASALSFPSGHATATAALSAAVVLVAVGSRWIVVAVVAGASLVVVAAAAQLLLARHYPSDIAAGWLLGVAWTAAVEGLRARSGRGPASGALR
jgi:undecaprenyl-diphosphatase